MAGNKYSQGRYVHRRSQLCFKNLIGFKAVPKKGTFLNANEKITFGQIEIYDENIGGSEENPGHIDLGEIKPDKNYTVLFDAQVKNGGCGAGGILVKTKYADTSLFEHSLNVTMKVRKNIFKSFQYYILYHLREGYQRRRRP